ncbi:hypothetical protein PsYK624_165570 [Phanerochaete sordida]|uniref:Uncharacterized protein n=1 Tax=Phanerochaete sordida TaxID=48140 RepID=A0A9P3LNQ4_9APHY|nr:hypothetical protein PsYK624_165570 [Phanerochaete sordida]
MHNVVAPVRYQSVSLMGNRRLRAFANHLVAVETLPVVHHLLIGDIQANRTSVFDLADLSAWQEEQERFQDSITALNNVIRTVLASSAPHLRSLGIHGWNFDPTADLPAFPLLHSITLLGAPYNCAADTHTRFPSLRRLHLLTGGTSHDFWLNLTRFAPHCTHLRLSNMSQDTYLPSFLRILLDIPPPLRVPGSPFIMGEDSCLSPTSPEAQRAVILASQLSALEVVYAQPASYKNGGWCGTGSIIHGTMVWGLKSVAAAAARGEGVGKFILLPEQELYIFADAKRDWLDVVEGGSGPWPGGPGAPGDFVSPSVRAKWPEEGNAYFSQPSDAETALEDPEDLTGNSGHDKRESPRPSAP